MRDAASSIGGDPELRAAELRTAAGVGAPPIREPELERLARARGVVAISADDGIVADGITVREVDGFHIIVRPVALARSRFTLAHEIGHTFFYERDERGQWQHRGAGVREEGWCHNFARALIMPAAWLRRDVAAVERPSLAALDELASAYRVSLEALVHRLGQIQVWPTLIILGEWSDAGWHVRFILKSTRMPGVSTGIRWGSAHPGSHLLDEASKSSHRHAAGRIDWPVAFRPRGRLFWQQNDFWAEARVWNIGRGRTASVMVVHHDDPARC